jgi:hypothetical protein
LAATNLMAMTSETLVNFYQTTRRYNPEDSHLRTHRRENLKSYKVKHEASTTFRTKKRGYLKEKINKLKTNKNKILAEVIQAGGNT